MATHTHAAATPMPLTATDRERLGRRAQLLAGTSVAYNVVEAVIAITAGLVAGSVALVGFGLDSVVEVSSGLIILWQFRHAMPERRERQALRLMALSFFALAAYITFESVRTLMGGNDPDASRVGIALAAASLVVMPFLSWAQRRTGKALGSNAVVADSTQTLLCTYLSAVLLVGLVLNATLGWSWADPLAGLVIAVIALKEGREAWRGEGCCAMAAPTPPAPPRSATTTPPRSPTTAAPMPAAPPIRQPPTSSRGRPSTSTPAPTPNANRAPTGSNRIPSCRRPSAHAADSVCAGRRPSASVALSARSCLPLTRPVATARPAPTL
jgi:Co/Zn/Cd efflux system component